MYYKLDENEQKEIKKASNYTITRYETEGDFIEVEALMSCIIDLLTYIDFLEEQSEDY